MMNRDLWFWYHNLTPSQRVEARAYHAALTSIVRFEVVSLWVSRSLGAVNVGMCAWLLSGDDFNGLVIGAIVLNALAAAFILVRAEVRYRRIRESVNRMRFIVAKLDEVEAELKGDLTHGNA